MSKSKNTLTLISSALIGISVSACGGGGGGGATPTITYSGSTTPAKLTATNSKEVSSSAYTNGKSGQGTGSTGNIFASMSTGDNTTRNGNPLPNSIILRDSITSILNKSLEYRTAAPASSRAVVQESDTLNGTCGGSATYTINVDDTTGNYTGNFSFNNFCEEDVVMSGGLSVSGNVNSNREFGTMSMTLSALTVATDGESFTTSGSISLDPGGFQTVMSMDLRMQDNSTTEVFWMNNMTVTVNDQLSSITLDMSGKTYHPTHGYVDLTTPTVLQINNGDEWPSSGVLKGVGDSSSFTLTATSSTNYQLDIDTDGDNTVDESTQGLWTEL